MPPRAGRRGKGPRDQSHREEPSNEPPSKLLSAILKTLSLSFERDIGMLNGKNVRSLPNKMALIDLQVQLEKLRSSLDAIATSDQETINTLRKIRDGQRELALKEEELKAASQFDNANLDELVEKKNAPENRDGSVPLLNTNNLDNANKAEVALSSNEEVDSKDLQFPSKRRKRSIENDEDDDEPHPGQKYVPDSSRESPSKKRSKTESKEGPDVEQVENDPSVKNPKSEFVVSQTLPTAAAALGLFSEQGLKNTGEDYLKKKYDVASYPTNDLKELLPGELPDMDFSHPKPTNQIQFNTFLSSVENIFRELNDEDIKFLKSKYIIPTNLQIEKTYDPEVTPYVIPKLGPLYTETWMKEDNRQNLVEISPPPLNDPSNILPKKSASDINESTLDSEEVSCGPLVSRLLSAILKDESDNEISRNNNSNQYSSGGSNIKVEGEGGQLLPDSSVIEDGASQEATSSLVSAHTPLSEAEDSMKKPYGSTTSTLPNPELWKINSVNIDYPTFEERLKRELKYVGIYINLPKDESNPNGDDPDWLTGREDDEISAELRELQNTLKQVTSRDQKRKAVLIPLVEKQLAWQEYSSILDDLDKQVDQAYIKRIRVPKKRKKNYGTTTSNTASGTTSQAAQQKAANSSLKALLDKRQRWIGKIGPLFDKPEVMKRMPRESVFRDIDQEEEEEETDVFGQSNNTKEDDLTET